MTIFRMTVVRMTVVRMTVMIVFRMMIATVTNIHLREHFKDIAPQKNNIS